MTRTTAIINFSAPPKLAKEIEKQAKKEARTKSELLRSAFESYMFRKKSKILKVCIKRPVFSAKIIKLLDSL